MLVLIVALLGLGQVEKIASEPVQYQFSYSTGEEGPAKMFREERRDLDGQVSGQYGYVDPYGQMRIVQYQAGPQGYIARGDVGPDREALRIARQLAEEDYREKLPILQHWNQIAARNLVPPSPVTWPSAAPVVPTIPTVPAIPAIPATPVKNVDTEIERASRLISPVNTWAASGSGGSSYSSSVDHHANNIQTVWPTHHSARIQAAPALANSPYAYFSLSQGGNQPYTINYSY